MKFLFLTILSANALHLLGDDMSNVEIDADSEGIVTDKDGKISMGSLPEPPKKKKK